MSDTVYWYAGKMIALTEIFLELRAISKDSFFDKHDKLLSEIRELGIEEEVNETIVDYYMEPFQEKTDDFN
jgi:hypothetical protein